MHIFMYLKPGYIWKIIFLFTTVELLTTNEEVGKMCVKKISKILIYTSENNKEVAKLWNFDNILSKLEGSAWEKSNVYIHLSRELAKVFRKIIPISLITQMFKKFEVEKPKKNPRQKPWMETAVLFRYRIIFAFFQF